MLNHKKSDKEVLLTKTINLTRIKNQLNNKNKNKNLQKHHKTERTNVSKCN